MNNGNGVSRGRPQPQRPAGQAALENAIIGIDLADKKQMVVVTDTEPSRVVPACRIDWLHIGCGRRTKSPRSVRSAGQGYFRTGGRYWV